ncbi:membrane protein insertase YidC [[Acholeplasma] multilocale]|uniref:membrane protein insertase YidC n=1 Tax=[Acholeplasma] multilocale TaxID=264638 RepID=UPI0006840F28|nr:membrane protein insertase YidC [[Acholeplasma] multilocale]
MYKADNSVMSYLKPDKGITNPKNTKEILKKVLKWAKILAFLFMIICMLWGCVQMYDSNYTIQQITDMTGNKVYAPGASFEIIIRSLGQIGGKNHWVALNSSGEIMEYGYNAITSWGEAWTKTGSPFYGIFVYPTAYVLTGIVNGLSGTLNPGLDSESQRVYGIAAFFGIFFTVLIIRTITLAFSWKSQKNQIKMQSMQLKQAEITAKYKDKKDPASKQKQQQETMALYKKEGVSPMSSIGGSFASMPFLFAIYAVIRSTRALKIGNVGEISLIEVPWQQIKEGNWVYFSLLAVYLPLQILSMLLPTILQWIKQKNVSLTEAQRKARKKQLIMQLVMMVVFIFVVATVASGVAIYWIISSTYQICQTLGFHFYNQKHIKTGNKETERRLRQAKKQAK